MTHIPDTEHPADLMTEVLSEREYQYLVKNFLHDIYDNNIKSYQFNE